jgi:hypothetical protein
MNSHYHLQNMKNSAKIAGSFLLIFLAGCSGGGSSGGSSTSSTSSTPPIPYFTDGSTYDDGTQSFPTGYWLALSDAYEIASVEGIAIPNQFSETAILPTYKDGGSNPVSECTWYGTCTLNGSLWSLPSPYVKNTTRYLQFNESHFIASPNSPVGTTTYITTYGDPNPPYSTGFTWGAMSNVHNGIFTADSSKNMSTEPALYYAYQPSMYTKTSKTQSTGDNNCTVLSALLNSLPNPFAAANWCTDPAISPASTTYPSLSSPTSTPTIVSIKFSANYKAQNMLFYKYTNGNPSQGLMTRYFVKDAYGNIYIMHASGQSSTADQATAFWNSSLPQGWTKIQVYLPSDLVIVPATGYNPAYPTTTQYAFNIWRDNLDSTYHQLFWGSNHQPAEYIEANGSAGPGASMEIWGGNTSDVIYGATSNLCSDGSGCSDHPIYAGAGNDTIYPVKGSHSLIDGGSGQDTVVYSGASSSFTWTQSTNGQWTVTNKLTNEVDTLNSVEFLQFSDTKVQIATSAPDTYVESSATLWLKKLAATGAWVSPVNGSYTPNTSKIFN